MKFDYYYGIQAEQFSFYRVPRILIKDTKFKKLSSDAKLLYGLMLDRMSLSMKNGWLDDENRAYIIYTIDSIMEDLGCAKATCVKIMKELDSEHGIGLIEKKRRGLGKPDIIYVKNFAACYSEQQFQDENSNILPEVQKEDFQKSKDYNSRSSEIELQEIQNMNVKKFTKKSSKSSENKPSKVQNIDTNYINKNYNNMSYKDFINPSEAEKSLTSTDGTMDEINAYITLIKKNIEYDRYMSYDSWSDRDLYEELYEIICEIVCVKCNTIKIDGKNFPYELVKSRYLKLDGTHLEYVIECMRKTNRKIRNIKAYMITALYNAPTTVNHYYQQEVKYDMYESKDIVD